MSPAAPPLRRSKLLATPCRGHLTCECVLFQQETAADRKAREKAERQQQRVEERGRESTLRFAETATLKLENMKMQLSAVIANKFFDSVSPIVKNPIESSYEQVVMWHACCQGVINGERNELPFDNKTLAVKLGAIKKDLSLCTTTLSTLARAGR